LFYVRSRPIISASELRSSDKTAWIRVPDQSRGWHSFV